MPPTNRPAIAQMVARLLTHYPTREETAAVRHAIARDWIDDLEEFSPDIVDTACREWRRAQAMRPTIADIRQLCIAEQRQQAERRAIADKSRGDLDPDTIRMWSQPEYHGDFRSPQQRRTDAIARQDERYRRAQAYRDGKLDEYDATHWPERLAERKRQTPNPPDQPFSTPDRPIGKILADLGITSQPEEPPNAEQIQASSPPHGRRSA